MKHTSEIFVAGPPGAVAEVIGDLSTYPHWNGVVAEAVSDGDADEATPAWSTTLRARVGPLARSKLLRLVRTRFDVVEGLHLVRFERRELDGRDHAAWQMDAEIRADGHGSSVTLSLGYDGGLWSGLLDPVLGGAIAQATERLPDYLASRG